MIRKMQQKFVAVVMLAYMILMLIVIGGINLFTYIQMNQKYDKMLDVLLKMTGSFQIRRNISIALISIWAGIL